VVHWLQRESLADLVSEGREAVNDLISANQRAGRLVTAARWALGDEDLPLFGDIERAGRTLLLTTRALISELEDRARRTEREDNG
jgi:hypothetical protein